MILAEQFWQFQLKLHCGNVAKVLYRLKITPNYIIATKFSDYFAQVYNSHKYVPPEFSYYHNHVMQKN